MTSHFSPLLLLVLLLASLTPASSQTPSELARLQNDFAMHYFEPEPHMALARYYLDHGNRLEAFFVLETARRGILDEEVFDHAFQVTFEGFDNSKAAEERLLSELAQNATSADLRFKLADIYISRSDYVKANGILVEAIKQHPGDFRFTAATAEILTTQGKSADADSVVKQYVTAYPESVEAFEMRADALHKTDPVKARQLLDQGIARYPQNGDLLFKSAILFQEAGELDKAEANFVRAATLAPKSVDIQSWVGRFFFKVRNDGNRALPYYLNAYFLSPHAYESEFVESRITHICFAQSKANFDSQTKAKKSLVDLLSDPDAGVVVMALAQMDREWRPGYVTPVTTLLGHESQQVRWGASELLKEKVDSSFDATLRALLKDSDLRKRGLAAYIAVHRWKNDSFEMMDQLLTEEAELLRFDALSALILEGGAAGRQHALAHAVREKHPKLRQLLENSRREKSTP
jgi:Tfp pilus assembly protein PilF